MKIGDKLKKARMDKKLTQEEVAEKIFLVSIFTLSVIVTGLVYSEIIKRF